jgi:nucleotide-binding universal stress UspA family protein
MSFVSFDLAGITHWGFWRTGCTGVSLPGANMSNATASRILVPIDFSACSREALRHALFWGRALDAQLDVLHVWEPTPYLTPSTLVWLNGEEKSFWDHMKRDLERQLEQTVAEARAEGDPPVKIDVVAGYVSHSILRALESDEYRLVVMGSHGRRGISRLLLGSVAERIVRLAPCPVLTVHEPEKEPAERVA